MTMKANKDRHSTHVQWFLFTLIFGKEKKLYSLAQKDVKIYEWPVRVIYTVPVPYIRYIHNIIIDWIMSYRHKSGSSFVGYQLIISQKAQ